MRTLRLHKSVFDQLSELQAKQYRQVISAIFDLLKDPRPHYSQPLVNSPYLRITVGEFLLIYRWDEKCVHVAAFGKRNDDEVYRAVERRS
jgi:mRNA interferase RelE/StbE